MASNAKNFQFELNETLYFNYGDEVLELVGISLNPDITIHPEDDEILMRGEIELRGEYVRADEPREDDSNEVETKRMVQEVESKEENVATFTHQFPVDITVPRSRVENIDDVRIDIVDFDYELPINSKLQFTATAEIQGVQGEEKLEEPTETEREWAEESDSFEFEVRREENQFDDLDIEEEIESETELDEQEESDGVADAERIEEEEDTKVQKENELTIRAKDKETEEDSGESKEEINDVSYLTDIFRKDEEERYEKMKICIVQEDDTIESIAERFQVSTLQLIKQNHLDDDFDITEGQLLYIPKK